MTVHCPHCSTGYLLPDHLMGPRGARVRCPQCQRPFVVLREPQSAGESAPTAPVEVFQGVELSPEAGRATQPAAAPGAPGLGDRRPTQEPNQEFILLAAQLLNDLAARLGDALTRARENGRVLAEFGPEIMRTYELYRQQSGGRAGSQPFRLALKERWGVDLAANRE